MKNKNSNNIVSCDEISSIANNGESIIECVPNFSEGRDHSKIDQLRNVVDRIHGAKVLHVDPGYDANRTVITFAGTPKAVEEAAFQLVKKASEVIDMRTQTGEHPRMGATDVLPLIPISGITADEAVKISYRLSERIASELQIPVFNYELSAKQPQRRRLETIRQGEYEGLAPKMQQPDWQADNGVLYNAQSGATVLGVRQFLLAYNVNLRSQDLALAKKIAADIRESGRKVNGVRQKGYFCGVKAIGWEMLEYGMVQVSTNITDTTQVGMHSVYDKINELAKQAGVEVAGSELIGLSPLRCILESGRHYSTATDEPALVKAAIESLGLNSVVPFKAEERIIEYLL